MPNPRPLTYTKRRSIRLTDQQREALRKYAERNGSAIGIELREATLEEIGRRDLSLAEETAFPIGEMLHRKGSRRKADRPHGRHATVNLTEAQDAAFVRAAKIRGVAVSDLIRNAGLKRAGAKPAKPSGRGRTIGSRNTNV